MGEMNFSDSGFLLVNKPEGVSSAAYVGKIKRKLKVKKIGHTGTLDPFASGLMILCLGSGTKLSSEFLKSDKSYRGWAKFGEKTDSADCTGEVIEKKELPALSELEASLSDFIGEQDQIPPMHSAIKKNGVPLYKLARKGQVIERDPRKVTVYEFRILSIEGSEGAVEKAEFEVSCSSGTYIRTLVQDWAEASGSTGYLDALVRTSVRNFKLESALTERELEQADLNILGHEAWVSICDPRIDFLRMIEISDMEARLLRLGKPGPLPYIERTLKKNENAESSNVILTSSDLPVAYLAWVEDRLKLQRVFPGRV